MSGQSGQLGDLVVSLSADLARFREDMGKSVKISQDTAHSIAGALEGVHATIGNIGKAFAGVTAVLAGGAMFKDVVNTTKEVAGEIVKLKNSLGMSAEEASVLRVALDDVFLTADDMAGAAARVTKQLVKNEDAFKNLGVSTRDSNGHFRSTIEIMSETNSQLMKFKEGTDRNVEGMKIYGKGWEEARKTLKLTAEAMAEGKKRAEELHLIFGDSGLKAVKDYRLAMKDLGDIGESFKVNFGNKIIPILTNIAVKFGDAGVAAIDFFDKIEKGVDKKRDKTTALFDRVANKIPTDKELLDMMGGDFTEYDARQKAASAMMDWSLNNAGKMPDKKPTKPSNQPSETSEGGEKGESDWTAAHNKYIEYEKAFEERRAAVIKIGNELELELNRQQYTWGLTDLDTYLTKKKELTLSSLNAEVQARQNELLTAQKALKELVPVTDKKGKGNESKDAENYHAALQKEELAQKALAEATGKLKIEKEKLNESDRETIYTVSRGYKEQQASLADFQGDFVKAAGIRKHLEEQAHERKMLETQAAAGDIEAEKALTALKILDMDKIRQAELKAQSAKDSAAVFGASIGQGGRFAKFDDGALALEKSRNEENFHKKLAQAESNHKALLTSEREFEKQKAQIAQEYFDANRSAEKNQLTARIGMIGDAMGQVGQIMMQGNKEQFEAGKKMAIASSIIHTIAAGIAAFTGITEATGGWGVAAGIAEMAVVVATGMSQVAQIESTQYQGRALGGPVQAGQTYIVNENRKSEGPEYFTPGVSGTITPAGKMGGGNTTSVTQVLQISTGVSDTVRAEIGRMLPMLRAQAVAAVQQAQRAGQFQPT